MSERLETHFGSTQKMSIRQTRKGWLQECIGCEAVSEFKWFETTDGKDAQFATSVEDSSCPARFLCCGCHEFSMVVNEAGTKNEIMTMHRPFACMPGACKCCCYQTMSFASGGKELGSIEEKYWYCIPRLEIKDGQGNAVYKVHPPTCCMGMCINICAEGNPCCGRGCCKVPFHIFPASQTDTDNGTPEIGKIVKVPKSLKTEFFTDADAFDLFFPQDSSVEQKALLAGTTIYLNANFFEADK